MKRLALLLVLTCGACVRVQPWQREPLTTRAMAQPLDGVGARAAHRSKLTEAKTGGGIPGQAPGGGCGCTQ